MDIVRLGRTDLMVSAVGLGCGGGSRLGQTSGATIEESVGVVREALNLGITYIDTAQSYGTEGIVGRALKGQRERAILSTKVNPCRDDSPRMDAAALRAAFEVSLRNLDIEMVDVFHLHAVGPEDYAYCATELLPELHAMRDRGQIRYLALSEKFAEDVTHEMLPVALADGYWDVVMVGFNMLNASARSSVFSLSIETDVGVEIMFAVRNAFSRPEVLKGLVADLVAEGLLDANGLDLENPLGFLVHDGGASSITEAAYRFARHEPGANVVLTGTGNVEHLRENVRSINSPPLPAEDAARLKQLFGHLAHAAGN